jgi:hypothetical protein
MITLRLAEDRGHAEHGWLDTYYTFSFADYFDPRFMGYRVLRVINDDRVEPGQGFGAHPHNDMEIITVVLEGALEHKDNMGNGSVIRPGDVQRMSAGTGVVHSEFNPSKSEPVHLLQIWILPRSKGIAPGYEQKRLEPAPLRLIASPDGRDGSLTIHQDAEVYRSTLNGESITYSPQRHVWIQIATGQVTVNGTQLKAGDGAAIQDEKTIELKGVGQALLFDLP